MSRYTTFYLWCPEWAPLAETNHPTLAEAIHNNNWNVRTPWCQFQREGVDYRPVESFYEYSTAEAVQQVRENYFCVTHNTRPEVLRQTAAIERRRSDAIRRHYDARRYNNANAPQELREQPYFSTYGRYFLYLPLRIGRDKTLHFQWRND